MEHFQDIFNDQMKTSDNRDMRNSRLICGIPPELDTISSRETLQITDEKKDDTLIPTLNQNLIEKDASNKELKNSEENGGNISGIVSAYFMN